MGILIVLMPYDKHLNGNGLLVQLPVLVPSVIVVILDVIW